MDAALVSRIEKGVDGGASALFGFACAFAAYMRLAPQSDRPIVALGTAAAGGFAYLLSFWILYRITPEPRRLQVPVFDLREIEAAYAPELLLTHRFEPMVPAAEEPLILDDVLVQLDSDSRVVHLFDPASMPTAGQLSDRIQRHLVGGAAPAAPQDASQALHDALAELRRSLR